MVSLQTPERVIDIITNYYKNKIYQIGQCPLCGYAVDSDLDEYNCHWCGKYLIWYKLGDRND